MIVILTLMLNGLQKTCAVNLPKDIHLCPGMNLILNCNKVATRIPIAEVDIVAADGTNVLRIDENFEQQDFLLRAPELEWFQSAP